MPESTFYFVAFMQQVNRKMQPQVIDLQRLVLPGDSAEATQPNELQRHGHACHRNGRSSVKAPSRDEVGAADHGKQRDQQRDGWRDELGARPNDDGACKQHAQPANDLLHLGAQPRRWRRASSCIARRAAQATTRMYAALSRSASSRSNAHSAPTAESRRRRVAIRSFRLVLIGSSPARRKRTSAPAGGCSPWPHTPGSGPGAARAAAAPLAAGSFDSLAGLLSSSDLDEASGLL